MFVSLEIYYVKIPMPKVITLGGWTFRRCLGHDSGDFMNEINVLIKETLQSSLASSTMSGHRGEVLAVNQEEGCTRM